MANTAIRGDRSIGIQACGIREVVGDGELYGIVIITRCARCELTLNDEPHMNLGDVVMVLLARFPQVREAVAHGRW